MKEEKEEKREGKRISAQPGWLCALRVIPNGGLVGEGGDVVVVGFDHVFGAGQQYRQAPQPLVDVAAEARPQRVLERACDVDGRGCVLVRAREELRGTEIVEMAVWYVGLVAWRSSLGDASGRCIGGCEHVHRDSVHRQEHACAKRYRSVLSIDRQVGFQDARYLCVDDHTRRVLVVSHRCHDFLVGVTPFSSARVETSLVKAERNTS